MAKDIRHKKLTEENYKSIRSHIFDRVHKTGQDAKLDFPNILETAIKTEAWKQFTHADGRPFSSLAEWLCAGYPVGIGLGHDRYALNLEDAQQLTKDCPEVQKALHEGVPKPRHGGDRRSESARKDQGAPTLLDRRANRAHSATVLSVRLAQEKPEHYDAYLRGHYSSVTAAATAAGILKNDANLRRTKSSYSKLTEEEWKEFERWKKEFDKWKRNKRSA